MAQSPHHSALLHNFFPLEKKVGLCQGVLEEHLAGEAGPREMQGGALLEERGL